MKTIKPFPKFETLEKDFPLSIKTKTTVKWNDLSPSVIAKYIINKKLVGKYIYKDYAEINEDVYETNKGMLKIYDEKLGIFVNADIIFKRMIFEFFEDDETKQIQNCCKFRYNKSPDEIIKKLLLPSLKYEINRVLERLDNHWNAGFEKGFLSIAYKNGTLILDVKSKKWKFKEEKNPNFLAQVYFNTNFSNFIADKKENRLLNFLDFKLDLKTKEKHDFIKALLFDWFFIENKSHHIICFVGRHSSGKSTFMEHLKTFSNYGTWCNNLTLSNLVGNKFSVPDWFYSNNIICNETSEKYFKDNSTFKLLVAKEVLSVEQKGLDVVFLRAFSKLLCLGEDPIRIKSDGGVDKRIMNFNFTEQQFDFTPLERFQYKDYLEEIGEKDKTTNDALLQYLAFQKYEDISQILIQGFIEFCNKNYNDNKRKFKSIYENLFGNDMEVFARVQNPFISGYETFLEPNSRVCVHLTSFLDILKELGVENYISSVETLKEHLTKISSNLRDYKDIKIFSSPTKNIKIKVEERGNQDFYTTLVRKNNYVFGLKLREKNEIYEIIAQKVRNTEEVKQIYDRLRNSFFTLTEESYKTLFPLEESKKIKIEDIVKTEQQAIDFKEVEAGADVTPHGQNKRKVDLMAEEIDDYFNPNKAKSKAE